MKDVARGEIVRNEDGIFDDLGSSFPIYSLAWDSPSLVIWGELRISPFLFFASKLFDQLFIIRFPDLPLCFVTEITRGQDVKIFFLFWDRDFWWLHILEDSVRVIITESGCLETTRTFRRYFYFIISLDEISSFYGFLG